MSDVDAWAQPDLMRTSKSCLLHPQSAVDSDDRAGDVGGGVGGTQIRPKSSGARECGQSVLLTLAPVPKKYSYFPNSLRPLECT